MKKLITIIVGVSVSLIAVLLIVASVSSIRKSLKEGPRPVGMPFSYRCTIQVIQGGKPLEGAIVTLHPEDKDLNQWGAIQGTTDAKGNAEIAIAGSKTYQGAFKGEYKVTISKMEIMNPNADIAFVSFVPSELNSAHTTPVTLTVSRTTKSKIDLGEPVRIEHKSHQTQLNEKIQAIFKVVFPCRITILNNRKPVKNAEVVLEPEDFHKYAFTQIRFQGITNEHGEATIKPEPRFSSSKDVMQYTKEGLPPDAFEIKVRIDDDKDFDLRTGKKLGSVTIVNKAVELEFDLKDFPSRFSSY